MSKENIDYANSLVMDGSIRCDNCDSNDLTIDEAHQDYEYLSIGYECGYCNHCGEVVVKL